MTTKTDTLLPVNKDLFVEFNRAYKRAYRLRNKEKIKQYERHYVIANRESGRRRQAKWRKANQDKVREYDAKWRKDNQEHKREYNAEWRKVNPESVAQTSRKSKSRRKGMGFKPLNDVFEGSQGHHVNNDQVIYIPEEMHRRYHNLATGQGMAEMNALAFQYLFEHT